MNLKNFINGIDVNRLSEIINIVKKNPRLARFRFCAKNTWMSGVHSRSVIKGFYGADTGYSSRSIPFIFDNDQPLILLGSDKGANPIEYVLNGLAGCLTGSIVYNAALKGIKIDEIESELEGNFNMGNLFLRQKESKNEKDKIKVMIRLKGNNLSENDKKFLCDLGMESSPVYKIITGSFPVEISMENEFYPD
jgi:uncharacterized OsmC-like protein